ncbi:integration host factor, actinobacterial type, partial [Streptomyces sp. NPDC005921]
MALPPLTPEQRAAALEKAAAARRERAEVKNRLKHSGASLHEVIKQGQENDVIGFIKRTRRSRVLIAAVTAVAAALAVALTLALT